MKRISFFFNILFLMYFSKSFYYQSKLFLVKIVYIKQIQKKKFNILKQNMDFQLFFFVNIVKVAFKAVQSEKNLLVFWRIYFTRYFNINYNFVNFKYFKKNGLVSRENSDFLNFAWACFKRTRIKKDLFMVFSELRNFSVGKRSSWFRFRKLFSRKRYYRNKLRYRFQNYYYYHLKIVKSKKKVLLTWNHFIIKFFKRKNNLFVNLSLNTGNVLFFITGGRFTTGKKKTSTLTAKHLARILCRMIIRHFSIFAKENFREYYFNRFSFIFEFNMLLHTPYVKTFFNIFRQFNLPIIRLVDTIKVPHSLGSKKKKIRLV
jgi:hypothetical protein